MSDITVVIEETPVSVVVSETPAVLVQVNEGIPGVPGADGALVDSILRYGADPTGATSSNAAILASIAANGTAYVPAGTYLVSDLTITSAKLYGVGTITRAAGATKGIKLAGTSPTVEGLTFSTSASAVNGQAEINLADGCVDAVIRNCKFTGTLYAAVDADVNGADDTSLTYTTQVDGFLFDGNKVAGSYSRHLYLHNIKNIRITNNHFRDSKRDSIRLRQATEKCLISGNIFDDIGEEGIIPRPDNWLSTVSYTLGQQASIPSGSAPGVYQCAVANSTIGANPATAGAAEWTLVNNHQFETKDALDAYWSGRELIVTHNVVNQTGSYGFDIKGSEPTGDYTSGKVIVSNNVIQGCFGCGINISSADLTSGGFVYTRGYIISNNYLKGNNREQSDVSQAAISILQGVSDCIIQGNMVVENYSRGIGIRNADASSSICKNISVIDNHVYSNGIPGGSSNVGINIAPVDGLIVRGNIVKNLPGSTVQTLGINLKDYEQVSATLFETPARTMIVRDNIVSGNSPSGDRYDVLLNNYEVPSLIAYVDSNYRGNTTTVLTMARTMFSSGAESSASTHIRTQAYVQIQGRIVLKARIYGTAGNLNSVKIEQPSTASQALSLSIAPSHVGGNEIVIKLPTDGAGAPVAVTIGDLEDFLKQRLGQGLLVYENYGTQPQAPGIPATASSSVSDIAFASSWDSDTTTAPSRNAVYDKISTMDASIAAKEPAIAAGTSSQYLKGDKSLGTLSTDVSAIVDAIQVYKKLGTTTQASTSATAANVNSLSFPIGANENWVFEFNMQHGCNNTGGVKYAIACPAGATFRAHAFGQTGGVTGISSALLTASGTLSGVAFNTVNSQGGFARIQGTVRNGATAGTVQLQFAAGVDTQTATLYGESWLQAQKVV